MTNSLELEGQVAIITGGGTGIGLAITTEMARDVRIRSPIPERHIKN
jgi:NAD(P)-dependent dehydrogenase (short-subunit alcohol dehydrogenase family)